MIAIEITSNELETIIKNREEESRKMEIDKRMEKIKKLLKEINELNGKITTSYYIGGKYEYSRKINFDPRFITANYKF